MSAKKIDAYFKIQIFKILRKFGAYFCSMIVSQHWYSNFRVTFIFNFTKKKIGQCMWLISKMSINFLSTYNTHMLNSEHISRCQVYNIYKLVDTELFTLVSTFYFVCKSWKKQKTPQKLCIHFQWLCKTLNH